MKKIFFLFFLLSMAYSFDIEKIDNPAHQIIIESALVRNNNVLPDGIKNFIIKRYGMTPFMDEVDSLKIKSVATLTIEEQSPINNHE